MFALFYLKLQGILSPPLASLLLPWFSKRDQLNIHVDNLKKIKQKS